MVHHLFRSRRDQIRSHGLTWSDPGVDSGWL